MNQTITVYQGKRPGGTPPSFLGEDAAKKVRAFHRSLEEYCETPLVSLDSMAKRLGVGGIYVKDESKRFGLNAFKALGRPMRSMSFCPPSTDRMRRTPAGPRE